MEFADLKRKTEKDLRLLLAEKRNELRELRFKAGEGQLKDIRQIREARVLIAQILTVLKEMNMKHANSPESGRAA